MKQAVFVDTSAQQALINKRVKIWKNKKKLITG